MIKLYELINEDEMAKISRTDLNKNLSTLIH